MFRHLKHHLHVVFFGMSLPVLYFCLLIGCWLSFQAGEWCEPITLRPPNEATSSTPVQYWQHHPEKLIFQSCDYEAYVSPTGPARSSRLQQGRRFISPFGEIEMFFQELSVIHVTTETERGDPRAKVFLPKRSETSFQADQMIERRETTEREHLRGGMEMAIGSKRVLSVRVRPSWCPRFRRLEASAQGH